MLPTRSADVAAFVAVITTGVALVTAVVLAAGQQSGPLERPPLHDRYLRVRHISESVFGQRPASDDEVRELLLAGMKDPDDFVRQESVGFVASILWLSSMPATPQGMEVAVTRRPVAESLWTQLDAAADDPESRVRAEALRGIATLFHFGPSSLVLHSQLANRLAEKFERDPSSGIRSSAVQGLQPAHLSEDPGVRSLGLQVLLKALEDRDPFVVQSAAFSAAESKPPEGLPLLVRQLKNPSHVARTAVAQGIAAYGAQSHLYLPQLEAALAAETDDITRKTIAGTISVITR